MRDRDRIGVNVFVAGGAALAGAALSLPGETVAAMVPPLVHGAHGSSHSQRDRGNRAPLRPQRLRRAELLAWVRQSERHAWYLQEAIEAE